MNRRMTKALIVCLAMMRLSGPMVAAAEDLEQVSAFHALQQITTERETFTPLTMTNWPLLKEGISCSQAMVDAFLFINCPWRIV